MELAGAKENDIISSASAKQYVWLNAHILGFHTVSDLCDKVVFNGKSLRGKKL